MKKRLALVGICLLGLLACGCSESAPSAGYPSGEESQNPDGRYKYTYTIEDLPDDYKEYLSKDYFVDMHDTITVADKDITIDSARWTRDLSDLEDNLHLPESVDGPTLGDEFVVLIANMTVTNKLDEAAQFYGNTFRSFSLFTTVFNDPDVRCFIEPFYQNPHGKDVHYFRTIMAPNETVEIEVGFLCDGRAADAQNSYLIIGTTGTTSDPEYYIHLTDISDEES